jgi:hypothetical protein
MKWNYGEALYKDDYDDPAATLDNCREAVNTLEDADRIARRVLGGAHPLVVKTQRVLGDARTWVSGREMSPNAKLKMFRITPEVRANAKAYLASQLKPENSPK